MTTCPCPDLAATLRDQQACECGLGPGCYHLLPLADAVRGAFFYALSQGEPPTVRAIHKHVGGSFRDVSRALRQVKTTTCYHQWGKTVHG